MWGETMDPLDQVPCYPFWRYACNRARYHVCEVLTLAGEPATPWNVARFVESLPRSKRQQECASWQKGSYFFRCGERAYAAAHHDSDARAKLFGACEYFDYLLKRPRRIREMMVESFVGVLQFYEVEEYGERERRRLTPSAN
jgi:hypothetical protein